ncbi:MAG: sulfatase-like hydrolase/transferase [Planctomycetota bacterium]
MSRLRIPALALLVLAASALRAPASEASEASDAPERADDERWNVIFFISDQHRHDAMGCAGNPVVKTPNMDRLATSGFRFAHMYSHFPLCGPSRASWASGQYPRAHRVRYNGVPMPIENPRIGRTLQEHGYHTGLIGLGDVEPKQAQINGYETYITAHHYNAWATERGIEDPSDWQIARRGGVPGLKGHQHGTLSFPPEHHYSTWVADRAIELMEEWRDEPFFLWVGERLPHPPYYAPAPYDTMYDAETLPMDPSVPRDHELFDELRAATAKYYGLTTLADVNLGRILDKLDELELTDRTIFVYSTDHGNLLGHHGELRKASLYDDDARLPFLMRYPSQTRSNVVIDGLAEQIDLFPTLLDLLDIEVPRGVQGRSMVGMMEGTDDGRDAVFGDVSYERRGRQMVRTKEWKLIFSPDEGSHLYHLVEDPHEQRNLYGAPEHREVELALKERLLVWNMESVDATIPGLYEDPRAGEAWVKRWYRPRRRPAREQARPPVPAGEDR